MRRMRGWKLQRKSMQYLDANVILRYILSDNSELSVKAADIIEKEEIEIPFEIIAEVVYVLLGVYKVNKKEIQNSIIGLFEYPNISIN